MRLTRYAALLFVVSLSSLGSCGWVEEFRAAVAEQRVQDEQVAEFSDELARQRLERPNAERVNSGPRGPAALRLWVGVWCDRGGASAGADGVMRVQIDGVLLSSVPADCSSPTEPPMARPNGTAFALTLAAGEHTLVFEHPDGAALSERFRIADDKWMMIHHRVDASGEVETQVSFSDEFIGADLGYDPENAPGALSAEAPDGSVSRSRALAERDRELRERELREREAVYELPVRQGPGNATYRIDDPTARRQPTEEPAAVRTEASARPASEPRESSEARPRRRDVAPPEEGWSDATMGSVTVRSITTLDVWVNGRSIGASTPVEEYPLPEGRHRVELRDSAGEVVRSFAITIEAGRTRTLLN